VMVSNGNSSISIHTAVVAASIAALGSAATVYMYNRISIEHVKKKLSQERMAERRGRIRAEVRLRTILKDAANDGISLVEPKSSKQKNQKQKVKKIDTANSMNLNCIGTVVSPFTKRMGTPRQGALAPHARGYIQIDVNTAPMEVLSGIDLFSHAWIIFQFHANTDISSMSSKTKVRPPRAGGLKVGQLATRSPHRPNSLGLSLVRIISVDNKKKRLEIAALDLVNGTPVYDIKPVVPWDIPGHHDTQPLHVPTWVSQEDALSSVSFTSEAAASLGRLLQYGKLAPLYKSEADGAIETICEILAQDPRCLKKRGTVDNNTVDPYQMVFCSIQLEFVVKAPTSTVTKPSEVTVINVIEFDFKGTTLVDGLPLSGNGTFS